MEPEQDTERFVREATGRLGQPLGEERSAPVIDCSEASTLPSAVKEGSGLSHRQRIAFSLPASHDALHIPRIHPLVESLASYLVGTALEGTSDGVAARSAAIRSAAVSHLTTLLLVRLRIQLDVTQGTLGTESLLAEECLVLGYQGEPTAPEWLSDDDALALLGAQGDQNVLDGQRTAWLERAVDALPQLEKHIGDRARSERRNSQSLMNVCAGQQD